VHLLRHHILSQNPTAIVKIIRTWPKDPGTNVQTIHNLCSTDPLNTYLLFDNAQDSYWDTQELWDGFFKDRVQAKFGPFVVLFCSYGSPFYIPLCYSTGTSLTMEGCARISLQPRDCPNREHRPAGLLFTRDEFDEAVQRYRGPDHNVIYMDKELLDMLFLWTSGHAGAVADFLHLLAHTAGRILASYSTLSDVLNLLQNGRERREGEMLTVTHFFNLVPKERFLGTLMDFRNFMRGVPTDDDLRKPHIAAVFHELLKQRSLIRQQGATEDAVDECHRHGWIQADMSSDNTDISLSYIRYTFASPLHGMFVSWKLIPVDVEFPDNTLQDMAFAIIKKFNPLL
jgi:hypothetical protein